jgi:hypothetical protein
MIQAVQNITELHGTTSLPEEKANPKSVIPACFKRKSKQIRTWKTRDKTFRG